MILEISQQAAETIFWDPYMRQTIGSMNITNAPVCIANRMRLIRLHEPYPVRARYLLAGSCCEAARRFGCASNSVACLLNEAFGTIAREAHRGDWRRDCALPGCHQFGRRRRGRYSRRGSCGLAVHENAPSRRTRF